VSTHTVALMAVDRAIYLKKPLTYGRIVTPWRMLFAIMSVWLLCTAIALPPLFGFGEIAFSYTLGTCLPDFTTANIAYILLCLVEICVVTLVQFVGCGVMIYVARRQLFRKFHKNFSFMRRSRVQRQSSHPAGKNSKRGILTQYSKSQLQLVKVFGMIFTASVLTYIPLIVLLILFRLKLIPTGNPLSVVTYIFWLSRAVIHPIIESYMTHEIRDIISKSCLSCKSCVLRVRSCKACSFWKTKCTKNEGSAIAGTANACSTPAIADSPGGEISRKPM